MRERRRELNTHRISCMSVRLWRDGWDTQVMCVQFMCSSCAFVNVRVCVCMSLPVLCCVMNYY